MTYRVFAREGGRWVPVGLDCIGRAQVLETVAAFGLTRWRVRLVGC